MLVIHSISLYSSDSENFVASSACSTDQKTKQVNSYHYMHKLRAGVLHLNGYLATYCCSKSLTKSPHIYLILKEKGGKKHKSTSYTHMS